MRTLYNILFIAGFCLAALYYFWRMWRRGNWASGFAQRFGEFDARVKQSLTNRHVLWLHAVSVGEVGLCTRLIRALEPRLPNVKFMVSTTTTTGMSELEQRLPPHIGRFYYPIDRRKYVTRAISVINPEAVILIEAEIWPNFIWRMRDRGTPVILANARLSERSCRGYKRFGFMFRELFASLAAVGAQNEEDAARLRELGARPEAIHVVGSLKFDAAKLETRRLLNVPELLRRFGAPAGAQLLVAGSTHAGEEALLAGVYQRLRRRFPDLFLVLVPRHFERAREVGRELSALGLNFAYRNELRADACHPPRSFDCLIVNTTGELKHFYEHATVVFVGKSLAAQGGQNPIEPAALGKPVVFGPNMQNFAEAARAFVHGKGARQVKDAAALEQTLGELLDDAQLREELGRRARDIVRQNEGAIHRTADMILQCLDPGEIHVADGI